MNENTKQILRELEKVSKKADNDYTMTTANAAVAEINRLSDIADRHYPDQYPPGSHWAITEAWAILDCMPIDALDVSQRSFLAGMIAGALMKAKG